MAEYLSVVLLGAGSGFGSAIGVELAKFVILYLRTKNKKLPGGDTV